MTKVLFIDNLDSFTFNLVDEFAKRGNEVLIYRNTVPLNKIQEVLQQDIDLIVISPGGFIPREVPLCTRIILDYKGTIPIFGVCLGMQCVVEAFGGKVKRALKPVHGKSSLIHHDEKSIFSDLQSPMLVGRYHSQISTAIPACLEISAKTGEGIVMGVRHKDYFIEGVQFHPESILTPMGGEIIENLLKQVEQHA